MFQQVLIELLDTKYQKEYRWGNFEEKKDIYISIYNAGDYGIFNNYTKCKR